MKISKRLLKQNRWLYFPFTRQINTSNYQRDLLKSVFWQRRDFYSQFGVIPVQTCLCVFLCMLLSKHQNTHFTGEGRLFLGSEDIWDGPPNTGVVFEGNTAYGSG